MSDTHKKVLSKGLNYSISHTEKDKLNLIAAVDCALTYDIAQNDPTDYS